MNYLVHYLGMMLASYVRVEGMKIENLVRLHDDKAPAYGEQDFYAEAASIEVLAREASQCPITS